MAHEKKIIHKFVGALKHPLRFLAGRLNEAWYKTRRLFAPGAFILVYHRISKVADDPHLLAVSPKNFRDQVEYLKREYKILPLSTLVANLKNNRLEARQTAITFDDGYADNLFEALPILEEMGVPATIFITTGKIDSNEPFYWDTNRPLSICGRPLSKEELLQLAKSPLIEIGAHTVDHPNLGKTGSAQQKIEIENSKKTLEQLLGRTISLFAYPFGSAASYSKNTIETLKHSGFEAACSTKSRRLLPEVDPYTLPRITVRDWPADKLAAVLKEI